MHTSLLITGIVLFLIGFVWVAQGANLIGGSFMTGQFLWLKIGFGVALVGGVLVWASISGRQSP